MTTTLTIDGAGRLVLLKPVREELQLSAGDSLELETSENEIVLRPVRGAASMRKKTRRVGDEYRQAPFRGSCQRNHPQNLQRTRKGRHH